VAAQENTKCFCAARKIFIFLGIEKVEHVLAIRLGWMRTRETCTAPVRSKSGGRPRKNTREVFFVAKKRPVFSRESKTLSMS